MHSPMFTRYIPLALLLLPAPNTAQVDIESLRTEEPAEGVSGSVGGDLEVKTGNTDLFELTLDGRMDWLRGRTTTLFIGEGGFGFLSGDRFAESGLLHLRQTYWLTERVAPEWFTQANYDRPQRLDFRALAGAGLRFLVASGGRASLGLGLSVMLEHERLDLATTASHPSRTTVVRNSSFATVRWVPAAGLVVTSTSYIQPDVSDPGDVRVLENFGLATSLTERLDLTVTFDLRYDGGPPDDTDALDTRLQTGIAYSF